MSACRSKFKPRQRQGEVVWDSVDEKRIKDRRLVELWGSAEFTRKLKADGPAMGDQRHEREKGSQSREAAG